MRFYLGTHKMHWLTDERFADVPLFPSHRRLRERATPFPRAVCRYAVDSGAFTEMSTHGRWTTPPEEYIEGLYRYRDELGPFDFAAPQDRMCESFVLDVVEAQTGRRPTVAEHQEATVASYLELVAMAPDLPFAPVLQADPGDGDGYVRCVELYRSAGVELSGRVVGVGSVCRLEATEAIARVFSSLHDLDPTMQLHGFGVKVGGLRRSAHLLGSSDSQAWSRWGRHAAKERDTPGGAWMPRCHLTLRSGCANCPAFALAWRRAKVLPAVAEAHGR